MEKLIYIADDEKNIRELIAGFLKNEGFEVKTFPDGDSLLEQFWANPSDMVILDVMMPGTDGMTVCSKIRERHHVPVIIVSAKDTELDRITGITMGSDDYLVKPFSPMELVVRVKALFRRVSLDKGDDAKDILHFEDLSLHIKTRECFANGLKMDLTPTEFSLMVYLFQHADRAVSREELLKHVWNYDFEVDSRVTDDVLKRLRKKLLATNVRIVSVWGFGFIVKRKDEAVI